jgi:hypothetical protein
MSLQTFEDMRANAFKLLCDAQDELRSDWHRGTGPTTAQAIAAHEPKLHIAKAKCALNRATR